MGNTAEEATGLSTLHMVAYTANFIVGSGFLTIPWAMTQCGIMLGTLTVIAIACLAMVASDCVLEALARAGPCAAKQKRASCDDRPRTRIAMSPPTRRSADERAENGVYGSVLQNELSAGDPSGRELIVGDERQDMTDLCEIFMGKRGGTAYIVTVVIYLYASLWAYAVLFAQTFASAAPVCEGEGCAPLASYWTWLLVFGVMGTLLALQDLTGRVMSAVQLSISVVRIVMIGVMLATLFRGLSFVDFSQVGASSSSHADDGALLDEMPPMWHFEGWYQMLPVALFSFIFHHSISTLAQPARDKVTLGRTFKVTLLLVLAAYLLVSVPAVILFRGNTLQAVNLNWGVYSGPARWGATNLVVFFPAISLFAGYPLMSITLANTLETAFGVSAGAHAHWKFRVLAAVPPIVASACVSDIGFVTTFAGICGFMITLLFPYALQIASRRTVQRYWGAASGETAYTTCVTRSPRAMACISVVGAAMTLFSLVMLIDKTVILPLVALLEMPTDDDDRVAPWGSSHHD